jgi:dephospho-CoA kinase
MLNPRPWAFDSRPLSMLSVALTGNIGAGKSTVAELFRSWGATIIDSDQLVREAQTPGHATLGQIVSQFGPSVLRTDGTLDRPRLRALVTADPSALRVLNAIVHPEVHRRRRELLEQARHRGDRIVISDIPLLFEAADPTDFDAIVLVDAPESVRRSRLLHSRSLTAEELDGLMSAQLPAEGKRSRSDFVIDNGGDRQALERSAASVWERLSTRA